jgi:two-component system chemotaxis sensor kinase CheA
LRVIPASQAKIVVELLSRAGLELVLAQGSDQAARARLESTLDELCAALMATPLEDLVVNARMAVPESPAAFEADAITTITLALEELERGMSVQSAPRRSEPAREAPARAAEAGSELALRDEETIQIFVDFIAESEEGLDRVEEVLLAADRGTTSQAQIDALFRVFHTIKGVAGFLGTSDVTRVAHVTETLLEDVRRGAREPRGSVLEVLFEASTSMRKLLAGVRDALVGNREISTWPDTERLVRRIEQVIAEGSGAAPAAAPGIASAVMPATSTSWECPRLGVSEPATATLIAAAVAPEAPAAKPAPDSPTRIRPTVKVDLERIDSVVEMIGELIIVESMVVNAPEVMELPSLRIRNYLGQLTKISRDLQNVAMRMRMVPVRGVFQKMARLARDLARKTGKNVQFEQVGDTTEMDRSMVERIEDPLIHMIRNAIDHAVETPEERRASGKPELATIRISARHEGSSIAIELSDDGRGLRREMILKKARQRGLIADSGEQLPDEDVYALLFLPGFSTAEQVSELSGRGVGMDVVKRSVESMRGRIMVSSVPGQGTTFKLILPLTLAIVDGMLVSCGSERYIIPSLSIVESLQPTPGMVRCLGSSAELLNVRGEILPLLRLSRLFELEGAEIAPEQARVVIVESVGRKIGLLVDDVLTQQQIVIKPLSTGLGDTELLAGAAIMSDGRVGLIVNVDRLSALLGPRRSHYESSEVAA